MSYQPTRLGVYRSCRKGAITFLISQVISCDHTIKAHNFELGISSL